MTVESRETLVEEDGAGAAHQRDADARSPPLTAREAAAAGEAAANPRVGDGSEGELGEQEVDEGGTVGDLTGSFGSSGANADSETSLLPSAEHSADHSTSIATASTPRCSRSWASTTLTTSITPCASGTDTAVWLSRGIQPATYDSFATSVVLLSTHCAFAHAAGSGSSPVQFSRSRQPSSR